MVPGELPMSAFDGRLRVLTSMAFEEPDRIPIDYWAIDSVTEKLIEHYGLADREALLQRLNVDLRYVMGPSFAGQQFRVHDNGAIEDHWGVMRKQRTVTGTDKDGQPWSWTYKHVHRAPLAEAETVKGIEAYTHWPSADQWDYSAVKEECVRASMQGAAVVNGGDRLDRTAQLKPASYLRGMEQFLIDLIESPKIAECILAHVADYYLEYNRRVFEAADGNIDIFFMGDDMGTQKGLWVSKDVYRRFFKANFRRFNELAHSFGIKTMYHTCGNVMELIGEFIDCGLDILQSLQPSAMDLAVLKRNYGGQLAFQGGIDIQNTMPKGSVSDVRDEVRSRAATLGQGGGYIFCTAHNLLPDVPLKNIAALFEAYLEYGRY